MVSAKIMKQIENEQNEEKIEMIERMKIFLKEKIDGDFEQISEWIDEFSKTEIKNPSIKKKTSTSPKKKKGTRPQSYYNYYFKIYQEQINKENEVRKAESESNGDDYEPLFSTRKERSEEVGRRWKEYKESLGQVEFENRKKIWENERDAKLSDSDSQSESGDQFMSLMVKVPDESDSASSNDNVSDDVCDSSDDEIETNKNGKLLKKKEAEKKKKEAEKKKKEAEKKKKKEAEKKKKEAEKKKKKEAEKKKKEAEKKNEDSSDDESSDDEIGNLTLLSTIDEDSDEN